MISRYIISLLLTFVSLHGYSTSYGYKKSYPVVSTAKFAFMDSIASMISKTDLSLIYSLSEDGVDKEYKITDFLYELTLYQKDSKTGEWKYPSLKESSQDFSNDGTYMLTVGASLVIPDSSPSTFNYYIFNISVH